MKSILFLAFILNTPNLYAAGKVGTLVCKSPGLFDRTRVTFYSATKTIVYKSKYDEEEFDYIKATEDSFSRILVGKQKDREVYIQIRFAPDAIVTAGSVHKEVAIEITRMHENGATASAMLLDYKCQAYAPK